LLENQLIAMDAIRVSLHIFLAMSMMTIELWALGNVSTPAAIANMDNPGSREIR
jgi:Na+/glutamate symporter